MREELNKILINVNDWLKFAEAKNAAILVFNSAAIMGVMQIYPADSNLIIFKGFIIASFTLSICITIFTFLPVLNATFKYQKLSDVDFEKEKSKLNCYFFRDHTRLTSAQLIAVIYFKIRTPTSSMTDIETDIARQIISNAEIAFSKFKLFSLAAYITFAGVVMGLFVIIFKLF